MRLLPLVVIAFFAAVYVLAVRPTRHRRRFVLDLLAGSSGGMTAVEILAAAPEIGAVGLQIALERLEGDGLVTSDLTERPRPFTVVRDAIPRRYRLTDKGRVKLKKGDGG